MGRILAYLCLLSLGGCVVPPAWTFWHATVEGTSYSTTRKSVTDHAISYFQEEDCALWRATQTGKVCRENVPDYKARPALKPQNVASVPAGMSAERYVSLLHRLRPWHLNLPDGTDPEAEIEDAGTALAGTGGQAPNQVTQPSVPAAPRTPVERHDVVPARQAAAVGVDGADGMTDLVDLAPDAGSPTQWEPLEVAPFDRGELERRLADAERRLADAERQLRATRYRDATDAPVETSEFIPLPSDKIVPVPADEGEVGTVRTVPTVAPAKHVPIVPTFVDAVPDTHRAPAVEEQLVEARPDAPNPENNTRALPETIELVGAPLYDPVAVHPADDRVIPPVPTVMADAKSASRTLAALPRERVGARPDRSGSAGLPGYDPRWTYDGEDEVSVTVAQAEPSSAKGASPRETEDAQPDAETAPTAAAAEVDLVSELPETDPEPDRVTQLGPISPRTVRPQRKPDVPLAHMSVMIEIKPELTPARPLHAPAGLPLRPSETLILEKTSEPGPTGDGWLSASNVSIDPQGRKLTVAGNVVISQGEHTLTADRVTYDRSTGVVEAHGNVSLVGPDGRAITSQALEVVGPLRRRVIERFHVAS